jgi:hypothetical protein
MTARNTSLGLNEEHIYKILNKYNFHFKAQTAKHRYPQCEHIIPCNSPSINPYLLMLMISKNYNDIFTDVQNPFHTHIINLPNINPSNIHTTISRYSSKPLEYFFNLILRINYSRAHALCNGVKSNQDFITLNLISKQYEIDNEIVKKYVKKNSIESIKKKLNIIINVLNDLKYFENIMDALQNVIISNNMGTKRLMGTKKPTNQQVNYLILKDILILLIDPNFKPKLNTNNNYKLYLKEIKDELAKIEDELKGIEKQMRGGKTIIIRNKKNEEMIDNYGEEMIDNYGEEMIDNRLNIYKEKYIEFMKYFIDKDDDNFLLEEEHSIKFYFNNYIVIKLYEEKFNDIINMYPYIKFSDQKEIFSFKTICRLAFTMIITGYLLLNKEEEEDDVNEEKKEEEEDDVDDVDDD